MKLTDLIVKIFGSDKVMHFLGGAWIVALATPFGWWGSINWFYHCNAIKFCKRTMA